MIRATRIRAASRLSAVLAAAAVVFAMSGCASKSADATPPTAPVALPTETAIATEPLSEPQTQAQLPPEQEIPPGAVPAERPPLPLPIIRPESEPETPVQPEPEQPVAARPEETVAPPTGERPAPRLGPILTEAQKQAYNLEIERHIGRVRGVIELLAKRRLKSDESAAAQRILAFVRQAEEARAQDLVRARNLAERAWLLAQDLERATR